MRILISILFIIMAFTAIAQQGLQMNITEEDSVQIELKKQIEYEQLISGNLLNTDIYTEKPVFPKFDIHSEYRNRYTMSLNLSPLVNSVFAGISSGMITPFNSAFYGNTTITSAGAYQLGNKLVLGGYSYGQNSIFSSHDAGYNTNNFDTYGSSIFIEYKVSKNFSIGTQINVSQGGQHFPAF